MSEDKIIEREGGKFPDFEKPKCDLCGSQLREENGKCICIRYIVKEKEE